MNSLAPENELGRVDSEWHELVVQVTSAGHTTWTFDGKPRGSAIELGPAGSEIALAVLDAQSADAPTTIAIDDVIALSD